MLHDNFIADFTEDFGLRKLSIALKEAGESDYWLKLLLKSQTISIHEYDSIKNDLNIIIGTLIKIIKPTKENMKNSENK